MADPKVRIRNSDITRAAKAMTAAGLAVKGVEVNPTKGVFTILTDRKLTGYAPSVEVKPVTEERIKSAAKKKVQHAAD